MRSKNGSVVWLRDSRIGTMPAGVHHTIIVCWSFLDCHSAALRTINPRSPLLSCSPAMRDHDRMYPTRTCEDLPPRTFQKSFERPNFGQDTLPANVDISVYLMQRWQNAAPFHDSFVELLSPTKLPQEMRHI
jgi:hypothetical protein